MCSSYYKILWHRQSKHTDIQIHPYDSTWYTFNKKSLAHLSLYRSLESISLIWVYIAHLSLYRSPESISLIWVYRSPESISLIWVYIAHLSLYRSSESISLIWVYIAHLSLYRSPESISITWACITHLVIQAPFRSGSRKFEHLGVFLYFCSKVCYSYSHMMLC